MPSYLSSEIPTDIQSNAPSVNSQSSVPSSVLLTFTSTGTCKVSRNCVCSSNFDSQCESTDSNYQNYERCTIKPIYTGNVVLSVEHFRTESYFDFLTIDGQKYSGSTEPPHIQNPSSIGWYSDYSLRRSGWKLCLEANDSPSLSSSAIPTSSSSVSCGGHDAESCVQCPYNDDGVWVGSVWCNGECEFDFVTNQCIPSSNNA